MHHKCQGEKADGTACGALPHLLDEDGLRPAHRPGAREAMAERGRKDGLATKRKMANPGLGAEELPDLRTPSPSGLAGPMTSTRCERRPADPRYGPSPQRSPAHRGSPRPTGPRQRLQGQHHLRGRVRRLAVGHEATILHNVRSIRARSPRKRRRSSHSNSIASFSGSTSSMYTRSRSPRERRRASS